MEDTMTGATAESPAAAAAVDAHEAETHQADSGDAGASDAVKDVAADGQKTPAATHDAQTDPDAVPLTAWADDVVTLPEGVEADADMLAGFGAAAVAAGLTRKQAQALVDWQAKFHQEQARAQLDAGVAALKKAWGGKAEANQREVLGLVSRIDRAMGDEAFSRALGESGATRHPGVVMGLHQIAQLMSEDSIGNASGAAAEHDETALEGLENALREARRK